MKIVYAFLLLFVSAVSNAQIKILFDATKAESAGNADWIIDADSHNLGFPDGQGIAGTGYESNPQIIPSPAQSGIDTTTPETYWKGGLSNWAIDCVRQGYTVETLPYNGEITYGVTSNLQDLSNYKIFVIDEPNILFTLSEKNAIISFVQNGGGLCIVSDHADSDRNNDGVDSPQILNDLMSSNSLQADPFGISFNPADFSQTSSNIANLPANPILHGTAGDVTQVKWSDGTAMTLNLSQNSTATGLVYKNGASTTGTTNVMCASAIYQNGKVVCIGDSSIPDDGTGSNGDTLYNGYTGDANGNHQRLLMNAIIWLATANPLSVPAPGFSGSNFTIAPNPIQNKQLQFRFTNKEHSPLKISVYDLSGRKVRSILLQDQESSLYSVPVSELNPGIYLCKIADSNNTLSVRFIVQ